MIADINDTGGTTMKIGILGAGKIAHSTVPAMIALDEIECYAVRCFVFWVTNLGLKFFSYLFLIFHAIIN